MKQLLLFTFCLGVMGIFAPQAVAGTALSPSSTTITIEHTPTEFSKKELRQQRRMERRAERRMKWAQRLEKFAPNALEGNLRYALLAAVAAIVLSVVGGVIGFAGLGIIGYLLGVLAGLAWLAAVVFFVLWLIDEIG